MVSLDLRVGSAPAPALHRIWAQAKFDVANVLRNGENLLLTLVIPLAVLVLSLQTPLGASRSTSESLVTAIGIAVLASAFTSQAISTGFDRRYGVLRLLGLSPLGSTGLLAARTLVSLMVVTLQVLLLVAATGLLQQVWPDDPAQALSSAVAVLMAVWAFTAWALTVAGSLRAEATLAVANAAFLVLMFAGGLVIPVDNLPWAGLAQWLPTGALTEAMTPGAGPAPLVVLAAWAVSGSMLAARFFRWES